MSVFGKTTLGLTYSLVFAEALLAPAIPSVRACLDLVACCCPEGCSRPLRSAVLNISEVQLDNAMAAHTSFTLLVASCCCQAAWDCSRLVPCPDVPARAPLPRRWLRGRAASSSPWPRPCAWRAGPTRATARSPRWVRAPAVAPQSAQAWPSRLGCGCPRGTPLSGQLSKAPNLSAYEPSCVEARRTSRLPLQRASMAQHAPACCQLRPQASCTHAGAYVMKTAFQTSTISSAMFITAMAANPLAVDLARDSIGKTISWGLWAAAGLVPGLICLITAPLILYVLYPPEVKDTPDAPVRARCEALLSPWTGAGKQHVQGHSPPGCPQASLVLYMRTCWGPRTSGLCTGPYLL